MFLSPMDSNIEYTYRSFLLFIQWIIHGREQPLGKVRHVWYRHEFQPDVGNLSHVHMMVWTTEIMGRISLSEYLQNADIALARLTADIPSAFGYVDDWHKREYLTALADDFQRHTCTDKCLTANNECRYHCPFQVQRLSALHPYFGHYM